MKQTGLIAVAIAACGLSACTTAELEAISAGLAAGMADASYYGSSHDPYYEGPARYGDWIGYNRCEHNGSLYVCDSDGDGYADMFGNAADGSYSSSSLKVNGRGEAFTWGRDCGCWERNRAYDGPRQPDEIVIYDGD